ncbi:DUF3846 domain-containing protein [Frankia sp. B2]|uniref:DUF3846 domain-containing protein n=1 Tax=Frankia sp. B2 TaxID=2541730 RepID=UPI00106C8E7F|nr:DUF3846 domain-containing protein [Frankia sp. B2]TFE31026.1 DUF3846 domain-containing protein [Frankia sp. B2]
MSASITGIRLPADRDRPPEAVTFDPSDLALMQGVVGGYLEAVELGEPAGTAYVNKDGLQLRLPVNPRVTLLARAATPARRAHVLVGNALLVGPVDADGRDTSVPEGYRAVLLDGPDRVRVELVSEGGRRRWPVKGSWSNPFVALATGLELARECPEAALRVLPA